jgi:hypothetical protein
LEDVRGSVVPCGGGLRGPKGVFPAMESRRKFLATILAAGVPAGILALAPIAQVGAQSPQNPQQQKEDDSHVPKIDPKATKVILEANQKDIKKNVEKLYDLASELKAEVEKTDSVQVLSVAMLRKTDEIEKLAREIRNRAKG